VGAVAVFLSGYHVLYAHERIMESAKPFLPKPEEKRETIFFTEDSTATVSLQRITSRDSDWFSLDVI